MYVNCLICWTRHSSFQRLNSHSLEDTRINHIWQNCTLDKHTFEETTIYITFFGTINDDDAKKDLQATPLHREIKIFP